MMETPAVTETVRQIYELTVKKIHEEELKCQGVLKAAEKKNDIRTTSLMRECSSHATPQVSVSKAVSASSVNSTTSPIFPIGQPSQEVQVSPVNFFSVPHATHHFNSGPHIHPFIMQGHSARYFYHHHPGFYQSQQPFRGSFLPDMIPQFYQSQVEAGLFASQKHGAAVTVTETNKKKSSVEESGSKQHLINATGPGAFVNSPLCSFIVEDTPAELSVVTTKTGVRGAAKSYQMHCSDIRRNEGLEAVCSQKTDSVTSVQEAPVPSVMLELTSRRQNNPYPRSDVSLTQYHQSNVPSIHHYPRTSAALSSHRQANAEPFFSLQINSASDSHHQGNTSLIHPSQLCAASSYDHQTNVTSSFSKQTDVASSSYQTNVATSNHQTNVATSSHQTNVAACSHQTNTATSSPQTKDNVKSIHTNQTNIEPNLNLSGDEDKASDSKPPKLGLCDVPDTLEQLETVTSKIVLSYYKKKCLEKGVVIRGCCVKLKKLTLTQVLHLIQEVAYNQELDLALTRPEGKVTKTMISCKYCGVLFLYRIKLLKHEKHCKKQGNPSSANHSLLSSCIVGRTLAGDILLKCDVCNQMFNNKKVFLRHRKSHSRDR